MILFFFYDLLSHIPVRRQLISSIADALPAVGWAPAVGEAAAEGGADPPAHSACTARVLAPVGGMPVIMHTSSDTSRDANIGGVGGQLHKRGEGGREMRKGKGKESRGAHFVGPWCGGGGNVSKKVTCKAHVKITCHVVYFTVVHMHCGTQKVVLEVRPAVWAYCTEELNYGFVNVHRGSREENNSSMFNIHTHYRMPTSMATVLLSK